MSSAKSEFIFFSYLAGSPSCHFPRLMATVSTSSVMLHRKGVWTHLALCMILRGRILAFPHCAECLVNSFAFVEESSFHSPLQLLFWIMNRNHGSWQLLSLILSCASMVCYIDLFNHPWIFGLDPTWLWCLIFLMTCWVLFPSIFVKLFTLRSSMILFCNSPFSVLSLSVFGTRDMLAS